MVEVALKPETGWASVRTYFRAAGKPDYYFLEMRALGQGKYFTVIPKPKSETKGVDMRIEVRDADGTAAKSADATVQVTKGCSATLNAEQTKLAQNLVAGETIQNQKDKEVLGFECEGVVSRIDVRGVLRPDEACRKAAIAAANRKAILIPALAVGAGGAAVVILDKDEKKETSPSR